MPKVVVFDLGKVLVDFDYSIAADKIARRSRCDAATLFKLLSGPPLLHRYETGLINRQEFYDEVCRLTGYAGGIEEFTLDFGDIFTEIPQMTAFHAILREHRIPTWIFSNTNDIAVEHIRNRFPFFQTFTGYVFSYEERSMKPDAKIYEAIERQTGRSEGSILYMDDRLENIEAGAARGWRTIQHQTPEQTLAAVRKTGLPIG